VLVQAWWRTGGTTSAEPDSSAVFADVVTAGQRRGDIRRDVDAELVGALILDAYVAFCSGGRRRRGAHRSRFVMPSVQSAES
jgi:hypothetical protein